MKINRNELVRLNCEHQKNFHAMIAQLRKNNPKAQAEWDLRDWYCLDRTFRIASKLRKLHSLPNVKNVLDVGAGSGCAKTHMKYYFTEAQYTGIDIIKHQDSIDGILDMALEETPIEQKGRFDLIHSNHVFEHIPNLKPAINTAIKLLAPYGMILHVTPHTIHDTEPAHLSKLLAPDWIKIYTQLKLTPLFLEIEITKISELRIILIRENDYPT